MIETIDGDELVAPIKDRLSVDTLAIVIINFDSDGINRYDEK